MSFIWRSSFHALILIAWLADGDFVMCYIVTMGRQIAQMFSTFSLWGCLFLMFVYSWPNELLNRSVVFWARVGNPHWNSNLVKLLMTATVEKNENKYLFTIKCVLCYPFSKILIGQKTHIYNVLYKHEFQWQSLTLSNRRATFLSQNNVKMKPCSWVLVFRL